MNNFVPLWKLIKQHFVSFNKQQTVFFFFLRILIRMTHALTIIPTQLKEAVTSVVALLGAAKHRCGY